MNDMTMAKARTEGASPRPEYPRIGLLINGEWIYERPSCYTVRNPSDERVLGDIPKASEDDLQAALQAADKGFALWRRTAPGERAALLRRTAALLRERSEQIAPVITLEQGKPLADARREIDRSASFLEWDAEQLLRSHGKVIPAAAPMQLYTTKEPVGPVAAFTPWNVPLSSPARKLSGAIAAGCSVIIKPAKETPAVVCLFARCFIDAGLPAGVLNLVFGDSAQVSTTLIASEVIQMVTLTGSVEVGKQLTGLAAAGMKPVLMELGGHAPVLIGEDVDPQAVARLAVAAKFRMAGQLCVSPSRFIIHQRLYAPFVAAFAREAAALRIGDGFAPGVQVGPLINPQRVAAIDALVRDAVSRGARVASGGERVGDHGCFYAPTVLCDVPEDARAMSEEPFGPLAVCLPMRDFDHGLQIANSLPVGLAGYVFTNSLEQAAYVSAELRCGSVAINNFGSPGAESPFGGMRESGIGTEGGEETLDCYRVNKTILQMAVTL